MINGENIDIDEAVRMRPLAAVNLRNHIEEEIRRAILQGDSSRENDWWNPPLPVKLG